MSSRHSSFHACVVPALIHSCAGLVNTTGREVELTCRLNLDSRELHLKYLLRVLVPHRETTDSRGSRQGTPPVSCFIRYLRPLVALAGEQTASRNRTKQNRTERRTHRKHEGRKKQGGRHEPLTGPTPYNQRQEPAWESTRLVTRYMSSARTDR